MVRAVRLSKSRPRAATSRLAARRFRSHSNGPARVSSKSLTSKRSSRSGEANPPKFARWASPHSCTMMPDCAAVARSAAIGKAAPTVVGEGRGGHAGVADRHQFGHPGSGLLSQEVERFERPLARMPLGQLFPR